RESVRRWPKRRSRQRCSGVASMFIREPQPSSRGNICHGIPLRSTNTTPVRQARSETHDLLFVGDAFIPYSGAPFVAEGSAEGYLGAVAQVLELRPRRLVHGDPR